MLKTRWNYWTCSKFADFIRGEKKPKYLELGEWGNWRDKMKKERPFRYYLSDTVLKKLQDFVYFPSDAYYSVKNYLRNRFVTQTHVLKSDLKKGEWYDLDTRILHCLFTELVEFVEIELASCSSWDESKKYKFKNGRCVEAAYDYFEWANNLTDSEQQKEDSIKIKELYEWWTKTRPNRSDLIEQDYNKEDTEKLIELIKIRSSLWT